MRKAPLPGIASENSAQSGTLAQDTIQMLPGTHDSKAKEEPVSLLPPQIFNEEQTLQHDEKSIETLKMLAKPLKN